MKRFVSMLLIMVSAGYATEPWWEQLTYDSSRKTYVKPNGDPVTKEQLVGFVVDSLNKGKVKEAQKWADMAVKGGATTQDFKNVGLNYSLQVTEPDQCVRYFNGYLC